MPLFTSLSLRRRSTSDQGSLPPPSYRSQPPSYCQTYTGLSEAANSPNELSSGTEPVEVEVPTRRARRPKVFLYYKIFREDGAIPCKKPVNPRDPYLARIEVVHITPPQTVASAIRCILKKEGHYSRDVKLFEAPSSLAPMEAEKHLSTMAGSSLGSDPRKPLALVIQDPVTSAIPAPRPRKRLAPVVADVFDQAIRATQDYTGCDVDARWLSYTCGDVLHTDRILLKKVEYVILRKWYHDAYRARDTSGRVGYVHPRNFIVM